MSDYRGEGISHPRKLELFPCSELQAWCLYDRVHSPHNANFLWSSQRSSEYMFIEKNAIHLKVE